MHNGIFSILVAQIDSILHNMVVLNVSQHVVLVIVHAEIWFIQNVHKLCTYAHWLFFSTSMIRINSILHIMIVLNVSQHVLLVIIHASLIRYAQCA